jgi:hypothetical protein
MIRKTRFTGILILASILGFTGVAGSSVTPGIEHSREIKARPDGNFDVVCIDGEVEIKTPAEVQSGRVCTHIQLLSGRWELMEGGIENGMRMCDLNITHMTGKNRILNVEVAFAAPCSTAAVKSEDCNGLVCSVRIDELFYSLDFSTDGRVRLTRLKDGFTGTFRGVGGINQGSNRTRVETVQGIPNILQVSNDNGATWLPVCDDGFAMVDAQVACREMGFQGVQTLNTSIEVPGDENYGLDDLDCNGSESSLFDCRHPNFGAENCSDYEHVQLYCN